MKNNSSSNTLKNHFLIFTVTLTALAVIALFTLSNALNMRSAQNDSLTQTQVIFHKPDPSGLGAAAISSDPMTSEKTLLPHSQSTSQNETNVKPFQFFWLLATLIAIMSGIFFMFRNMKEDHDMKAISHLHALARVEH